MSQDMMKGRHESFPWFTSVVLFGTFGLILVMLLINSGAATPTQTATLAATAPVVAAVPTEAAPAPAQTTAGAAGPAFDMQKVADGQHTFQTVCFACHGMDAKGIPGLGKNLIESTFVHGLKDQELVAFITKGRPATDPTNTTGIAMPAKGGNPALTDAQLQDVVTFIRYQTAKDHGQLSAAPAAPAAPAATTPPPAQASVTEASSGGLPIDSILKPAGGSAATATEESSGGLPIDSILKPSGGSAPTEAAPTAEATTAATEAPFSLPINSVLTPSGG